MESFSLDIKDKAYYLNDVVESMNIDFSKDLSDDEKIYFTYMWFSDDNISVHSVYEWSKLHFSDSLLFRFLLTYLKVDEKGNYPEWIGEYEYSSDKSYEFKDNEEVLRVDGIDVESILKTLKVQDIPFRNCIVEGAIKSYAFDEMFDFINGINKNKVK